MYEEMKHLEKLRKKAKNSIIIINIVSVIITLICFFTIEFPALSAKTSFLLCELIGAICGFLLYTYSGGKDAYDSYKTYFRALLVEIPFTKAFGQVIYDADRGFAYNTTERADLIYLGNRYHSSNYVQGSYKDIKFKRADVNTPTFTGLRTSSPITYFIGRWLIIEFNEELHFDLQIVANELKHLKNNLIATKEGGRHPIVMGDIDFNNKYTVYAQDDSEAFYLLTPQFIDNLKRLQNLMDGPLMFSFAGSQLHVAISNVRDTSEPSIYHKINNTSIAKEIQNEIYAITLIIDGLNHDRSRCT